MTRWYGRKPETPASGFGRRFPVHPGARPVRVISVTANGTRSPLMRTRPALVLWSHTHSLPCAACAVVCTASWPPSSSPSLPSAPPAVAARAPARSVAVVTPDTSVARADIGGAMGGRHAVPPPPSPGCCRCRRVGRRRHRPRPCHPRHRLRRGRCRCRPLCHRLRRACRCPDRRRRRHSGSPCRPPPSSPSSSSRRARPRLEPATYLRVTHDLGDTAVYPSSHETRHTLCPRSPRGCGPIRQSRSRVRW